MVIMASSIARKRVCTTTVTAATELLKMAAILQQPNRLTETCSLCLQRSSLALNNHVMVT